MWVGSSRAFFFLVSTNSLDFIQVQTLLQGVQDKFQTMSDQIISRIDDMGTRIDELEKSIGDLMQQANCTDSLDKWPGTEISSSYSNEKF